MQGFFRPTATQLDVVVSLKAPSPRNQPRCICRAEKDNPHKRGTRQSGLGDDLLDFMYAGKKLRKWYGQEGPVLPQDSRRQNDSSEARDEGGASREVVAEEGLRDVVLVLDTERSLMADQTLLQLILLRWRTKILVKDLAAARTAYGSYVEASRDGLKDEQELHKFLKDVKCIVACDGIAPETLKVMKEARVPRIVLLSMVGASAPTGLAAIFGSRESSVLRDQQREAAVLKSGMEPIIVRVNAFSDEMGGKAKILASVGSVDGEGKLGRGSERQSSKDSDNDAIAREDAALVLAQAAVCDPTAREEGIARSSSKALVLNIKNGGPGRPPEDWQGIFEGLLVAA